MLQDEREANPMKNIVIITVERCSRCGKKHLGLVFGIFALPPEDREDSHDSATHWARCPKTGEPILYWSK